MVFRNASKSEEGSNLLSVKKRSEDVSKEGRPKFGKRLSAIFKKPNEKHQQFKDDNKDDVTPPPSPDVGADDGPVTLRLMVTAYPEVSPPPRQDDEEDRSNSGTTISDLSASVQRFKGKPFQSPMKEVEEESAARDTEAPTKNTLMTDESAKERNSTDSYSRDSVVASLFGMADDTCFSINPCGLTTDNERSGSESVSRATGRSYPTWGTAPSGDDDDDTNFASTVGTGTLFTEDKTNSTEDKDLSPKDKAIRADLIRKDLETDPPTIASTKVSLLEELDIDPPDAAPAPVSPDRSHENFELILDPAALKSDPHPPSTPKRKTLNWMRNKSSLVEEEKKEKDDAGSRRKQSKSTESSGKRPAFVKRLTSSRNAAKQAATKPSTTVTESSSARNLSGTTKLTDELLVEGELLGEEILEENEGSVLSATYTEMANIDPILGIKAVKETKDVPVEATQGKDVPVEATQIKDVPKAAAQTKEVPKAATVIAATPEKSDTEKRDPFDNTPKASNVNIGDGRSRSWNVLTKALAKRRSKPEERKDFTSRTASSPMRLSNMKSSASSTSLWKTAEDPNSGRTYYYHKLTRKTTWSKPKNYDAILQQEQELSEKALGFQEHSKAVKSDVVISSDMSSEDYWEPSESSLKKLPGTDLDRSLAKKREITRLLTQMAPPDDSSVVNLMEQYRGREDELLVQLQDLVKSKPFDEPVKNAQSLASDLSDPDNSGPKSLTKTRTSNTSNTGMSGITEKTERIKNTANPGYVFEAIKESDENFDDESISSNNLSTLTDPATPDRSESKPKRSILPTGSPSGRTTERTRDLLVEEFSSSRLNVENYDKQATVRTARQRKMDTKRALRDAEPSTYALPSGGGKVHGADSIDSEYSGGVEDSDIETYTDTVSALSFTEPEYTNRKDNFDQARRKALDEAIRLRDWELAASVAENMRMRSMDDDRSEPSDQYEEWTQSELDKFISENDWDAVASYIAQMRDSGKAYAARMMNQEVKERESSSKNGTDSDFDKNIQKRFGARSQLQHTEGAQSVSSWESESFYESDDASSSSSLVSFGDIHRLVRKEFAC
jgi:hypothetical protein